MDIPHSPLPTYEMHKRLELHHVDCSLRISYLPLLSCPLWFLLLYRHVIQHSQQIHLGKSELSVYRSTFVPRRRKCLKPKLWLDLSFASSPGRGSLSAAPSLSLSLPPPSLVKNSGPPSLPPQPRACCKLMRRYTLPPGARCDQTLPRSK